MPRMRLCGSRGCALLPGLQARPVQDLRLWPAASCQPEGLPELRGGIDPRHSGGPQVQEPQVEDQGRGAFRRPRSAAIRGGGPPHLRVAVRPGRGGRRGRGTTVRNRRAPAPGVGRACEALRTGRRLLQTAWQHDRAYCRDHGHRSCRRSGHVHAEAGEPQHKVQPQRPAGTPQEAKIGAIDDGRRSTTFRRQ